MKSQPLPSTSFNLSDIQEALTIHVTTDSQQKAVIKHLEDKKKNALRITNNIKNLFPTFGS